VIVGALEKVLSQEFSKINLASFPPELSEVIDEFIGKIKSSKAVTVMRDAGQRKCTTYFFLNSAAEA
jgi:hypothetical protein